jgi:hypothetical protein
MVTCFIYQRFRKRRRRRRLSPVRTGMP